MPTSQYRAATGVVTLVKSERAADPAMLTDLWPMLVVAALDPHDRQQWASTRPPAGQDAELFDAVLGALPS